MNFYCFSGNENISVSVCYSIRISLNIFWKCIRLKQDLDTQYSSDIQLYRYKT